LFRSLHNNFSNKSIYIIDNPGEKECDKSIAEKKGWKFRN